MAADGRKKNKADLAGSALLRCRRGRLGGGAGDVVVMGWIRCSFSLVCPECFVSVRSVAVRRIFAMVDLEQPVAACIVDQDCFAASIFAMSALRSSSTGRPL
jgi:hypothetical protein